MFHVEHEAYSLKGLAPQNWGASGLQRCSQQAGSQHKNYIPSYTNVRTHDPKLGESLIRQMRGSSILSISRETFRP